MDRPRRSEYCTRISDAGGSDGCDPGYEGSAGRSCEDRVYENWRICTHTRDDGFSTLSSHRRGFEQSGGPPKCQPHEADDSRNKRTRKRSNPTRTEFQPPIPTPKDVRHSITIVHS